MLVKLTISSHFYFTLTFCFTEHSFSCIHEPQGRGFGFARTTQKQICCAKCSNANKRRTYSHFRLHFESAFVELWRAH